MELIDREALIEAVNIQLQNALDVVNITGMTLFKQEAVDCKNFIALIKEMPTVEPPKGKWCDNICSVCCMRWDENMVNNADDWGYFDPMPNYCPNCGADMRKKVF